MQAQKIILRLSTCVDTLEQLEEELKKVIAEIKQRQPTNHPNYTSSKVSFDCYVSSEYADVIEFNRAYRKEIRKIHE